MPGMYLRRLVVVLIALLPTGCFTTTYGTFVTNGQFVYPNSNVKLLGPASAVSTTASVVLPADVTHEQAKQTYESAIASVAGANILVNYAQDTTYTYILAPFIYSWVEYRIEGQAANMEIGLK